MEFIDELKRLLENDPDLREPQVQLANADSGRVGGYIVSGSFGGHDQMARQDMVWDYLQRKLKPEQLIQINLLLTLTPEEADEGDEHGRSPPL